MTTSTDGQICFGIVFEDKFEFPWNSKKRSGGIDDWWIYDVCGLKHSFKLYTKQGEYVGGAKPSQDKINAYWEEKRVFATTHPLPVELVNVCSHDYPQWIIALPGKTLTANRGFPQMFDPAALVVTEEEKQSLLDFCEKHGIATDGSQPAWYLSSFWG